MKVQITHLKAPWPPAAVVGDIVAFKGEPPVWAVGKFTTAPPNAVAIFTYEPGEADPWEPAAATTKSRA